jgi:RNA polymerase sigma-70 factor (ECF subfamily)
VSDAIPVAAIQMSGLEPVQSAAATAIDLARGKPAAEFGAALEGQTPVLLASARALLRNEADARDLVQTTLEIASRRIGELRDPLALRPWLLAIQVREAFRLRRRLARFIHLAPAVLDIQGSPGPDSDMIALRAALPKLPPRARAAVVLHYLGGLSVAEVARAMDISENTTKGHLNVGLVRLREELRDD